MTKFQKQMLTIAAAGALTAVTALPAMAFENEFHGLYNFNGFYQNYDNNYAAAGTTVLTNPIGSTSVVNPATAFYRNTDKVDNYFEQRVRLQYIAKASDDLKLVTHFEINNRFGQKSAVPTGNGTGGAGTTYQSTTDFFGSDLDTDGTNIVTKNAYLDFNITKNLKAMVGLQGYKDSIGGIFINADVPALVLASKMDNLNTVVGFTRYNDQNLQNTATMATAYLGDISTDLVFLDASYAINKNTKVGASYYLLRDEMSTAATGVNKKTTLHTFAVNGATSVSGVKLQGFVAVQSGSLDSTTASNEMDYSGWAANIQATTGIAGGTAKAGFLYVSGDTNSDAKKSSAWQQTGVSSFDDSGMMIMLRNNTHASTSTVYFMKGATINNIQLAYLGYDRMLTDKLGVKANVGFGWDAAQLTLSSVNAGTVVTTNSKSGDYLGTEFNGEVNYKLYPNLTLVAQAGIVKLGDEFDGYKNPFSLRAGARFSF